jgi:hypothetical protein
VSALTWRPNKNHHAFIQEADRDPPLLTIQMALVQKRDRRTCENFGGAAHV